MSVMQRQVKFVISISGRRLYAVKSQFRWVENELSKKKVGGKCSRKRDLMKEKKGISSCPIPEVPNHQVV
jgi:hypothetical protein